MSRTCFGAMIKSILHFLTHLPYLEASFEENNLRCSSLFAQKHILNGALFHIHVFMK